MFEFETDRAPTGIRSFRPRVFSSKALGPFLQNQVFRQSYNIILNEVVTQYILLASDKNKDMPFNYFAQKKWEY